MKTIGTKVRIPYSGKVGEVVGWEHVGFWDGPKPLLNVIAEHDRPSITSQMRTLRSGRTILTCLFRSQPHPPGGTHIAEKGEGR